MRTVVIRNSRYCTVDEWMSCCARYRPAISGDLVSIHMTSTIEDGEIFHAGNAKYRDNGPGLGGFGWPLNYSMFGLVEIDQDRMFSVDGDDMVDAVMRRAEVIVFRWIGGLARGLEIVRRIRSIIDRYPHGEFVVEYMFHEVLARSAEGYDPSCSVVHSPTPHIPFADFVRWLDPALVLDRIDGRFLSGLRTFAPAKMLSYPNSGPSYGNHFCGFSDIQFLFQLARGEPSTIWTGVYETEPCLRDQDMLQEPTGHPLNRRTGRTKLQIRSRRSQIDFLMRALLVQEVPQTEPDSVLAREGFMLTPEGKVLLDLISPDIYDPFFAQRRRRWSEMGLEESKAEIDLYVEEALAIQRDFHMAQVAGRHGEER